MARDLQRWNSDKWIWKHRFKKYHKKKNTKKYRPASRIGIKRKMKEQKRNIQSSDEMLEAVNQYFIDGFEVKDVIVGRAPHQQVVEQVVISITGLALYLGFHSIPAMDKAMTRSRQFLEAIMYGKTRVAMHYEGLMQSGVAPSAMVFMLSSITGIKAENPVLEASAALRTINFIVPKTKQNVIDVAHVDLDKS